MKKILSYFKRASKRYSNITESIDDSSFKAVDTFEENLEDYVTALQRYNYLVSKVDSEMEGVTLDTAIDGYLSKDLLLESLKNDEIWIGLSRYSGLNGFEILSNLSESGQESFNYLISLYAMFSEVSFEDTFKENIKTKPITLTSVSLAGSWGDSEELSPWECLAQGLIKNSDSHFDHRFNRFCSEYIEADFIAEFLNVWRNIFSVEIQEKVSSILEDSDFCSIKNLYELSISAYKESIGEENDSILSILNDPAEWIRGTLDSEDCRSKK